MATVEAQQYAEALRKSLLDMGLDDGDVDADDAADYLDGMTSDQLKDLDKDIAQFANHEVIRSILDQGRVLAESVTDVDDKLRQVELESIQDYIQESDNLVALHEQIRSCDAILAHMEELLGNFQTDLGKVSDEIRALQVQSQTMSTKLQNRRVAEERLGRFVEAVAVSEEIVAGIMDAEVSEDYLEHLLALDRKLSYLSGDASVASSQARRDVEPVLAKLRVKAVAKVRDFLMARIYALRKPKTNVSIIQQSVLLKFKYFARFLRAHAPDVFEEVRSEYCGVVSKVLTAHFRAYLAAVSKLVAPVAGASDVLGVPDAPPGGLAMAAGVGSSVLGMFRQAAGGGGVKAPPEAVFELGERGGVLALVDQSPLVPHMVEAEGRRYPYEAVFRSVHKLLMDAATSEFLFCLDFFEDEGLFRELVAPVVAAVEADLSTAVQEQQDVVCLLLLIRINAEHRRVMAGRRVPCLDDYLDRVDLLLWPRFKVLLDAQQHSVRPGSERALFDGAATEHPMVRRYAALASSLMRLMGSEDGVFQTTGFNEALERLWAAVFDLLLRMSNMFKERRQGIVFLILNYAHIKRVWRAADAAPPAGAPPPPPASSASSGSGSAAGTPGASSSGAEQPTSPTAAGRGGLGAAGAAALKECEEQLASCTGLYMEDQLGAHFKELVAWVKKAEQAQKRLGVAEGAPIPGYGPREAAPLLRDFSVRWQGAIDAMHRETVRQFADAGCGREVLQACMTQLLLYYTRVLELLKRQGPEGAALAREAVNIPSIMYEIKRITKA